MKVMMKIIVEVKKSGKMSEQEERNLINIEKDIHHSPFAVQSSFYVNVFLHQHCKPKLDCTN